MIRLRLSCGRSMRIWRLNMTQTSVFLTNWSSKNSKWRIRWSTSKQSLTAITYTTWSGDHSKPKTWISKKNTSVSHNLHLNLISYIDDYFMDFAIPDKKIIVEVNGPSHYIAPSKELNMTSESKIRLLEKKGWTVVIVPFFVNENPSDPKFEELMDFKQFSDWSSFPLIRLIYLRHLYQSH